MVRIARERGTSVSATIADLTALGLSQLGAPLSISTAPQSGFPTVDIGRPVTSEDVSRILEEE